MTNEIKPQKGLLKVITAAAARIGKATLRERAVFDEVIYPLLEIYNAANELLTLAAEVDPKWKKIIEDQLNRLDGEDE